MRIACVKGPVSVFGALLSWGLDMSGRVVAYARVSGGDQNPDRQTVTIGAPSQLLDRRQSVP